MKLVSNIAALALFVGIAVLINWIAVVLVVTPLAP
jgi:hypothetical protein